MTAEPGAHRPLGVVLMRLRIAEIEQHPVAHILGDKAVEAADRISDNAVVVPDQLAQILRVKPRRERGGADQVAEHHRQLPAFGIGRCRATARRRRHDCGHRSAERGNRIKQHAAMASKHHAEILEILRRQLG